MDKTMDASTLINHHINIVDRKSIIISGVKKIISFDNEEFLMLSNMGTILLKGSELEIVKLDTQDGNVSIKGKINSLGYIEDKHTKEESLLSKLFK